MGGTKRIRTFEKWVYRASIDVDRWLKNNGISSILEWNEWCDKNNLQHPLPTTVQVHLNFGRVAEKEKDTALASTSEHTRKHNKPTQEATAPYQATAPWHTPAAQRPRRKADKRKKVKSSDS